MKNSAACLMSAILCVSLTSCSEVEELELSNATLEGKITYNGQPVPHALVIVAGDTSSATATAGPDGQYKVDHAPLGSVKIGINTQAARGAMMGQMMAKKQKAPGGGKPDADAAAAPPKLVDLPEKYFTPDTSGISTTVNEGPNTFDIQLK
ncbi:MAG: hypothetical protein ACYC0X_25300 [Pirellulaceae bacterium]